MHVLAWTPFLNPLPVWSDRVWPWLLLPLAAAISVVYKSIKCRKMRRGAQGSRGHTEHDRALDGGRRRRARGRRGDDG